MSICQQPNSKDLHYFLCLVDLDLKESIHYPRWTSANAYGMLVSSCNSRIWRSPSLEPQACQPGKLCQYQKFPCEINFGVFSFLATPDYIFRIRVGRKTTHFRTHTRKNHIFPTSSPFSWREGVEGKQIYTNLIPLSLTSMKLRINGWFL